MKRLVSHTLRSAGRQALTSTATGRRRLGLDEALYQAFKRLPVWDAKWYVDRHPDVRATGLDPLFHYLRFGLAEGRDPGPYYELCRRLGSRHEEIRGDPRACALELIDDVQRDPLFRLLDSPEATVRNSGLFDERWYVTQYKDIQRSKLSPLRHYLLFGSHELRSPGPRFDAEAYVHEHGLSGRLPFNALLHYLINGGTRHGNAVDRAGMRKRALAHATRMLPLEPDLLTALRLLEQDTIPVVGSARNDRVGRAWRQLYGQLDRPYRYLLLVPWVTHGGADLVALHAARLALEKHTAGEVLLVVADTGNLAAREWLPGDLRTLVLSDADPTLTLPERVELLLMAVRALKPHAVLNVNSRVGWELYEQYGRPLSRFSRLFATLFCPDYDQKGRVDGYAHRYFRSTLPHLTAIYFDNTSFIDELWAYYAPPTRLRERLRAIYQPAELIPGYQPPRDRVFKSLWAGRLCSQKNLPTLIALAALDPAFQYHVYGRGDTEHTARMHAAAQELPNLQYHGSYSSFEALPLSSFDAYVYTTLWDGLPNALLAAAGAGMPVVAPAVGGISELVNDDTGWLVRDPEDADRYLRAIQHIRDAPHEAARRTRNMRELVASRHSWSAYSAAMAQEPSFLGA